MLEDLNVDFRNIGGRDEAVAGQTGLVADDQAGQRRKVLLGAILLNGSEEGRWKVMAALVRFHGYAVTGVSAVSAADRHSRLRSDHTHRLELL